MRYVRNTRLSCAACSTKTSSASFRYWTRERRLGHHFMAWRFERTFWQYSPNCGARRSCEQLWPVYAPSKVCSASSKKSSIFFAQSSKFGFYNTLVFLNSHYYWLINGTHIRTIRVTTLSPSCVDRIVFYILLWIPLKMRSNEWFYFSGDIIYIQLQT